MRQGIGTISNAWAVAVVLAACHYDVGTGRERAEAGTSAETGPPGDGGSSASTGNGGASGSLTVTGGVSGSGAKTAMSGGSVGVIDASIDGAPDSTVPAESGSPAGDATGTGGKGTGGASTGGHGGNGGVGTGGVVASGGAAPDAEPPAHWCDGQTVLFCEDFDELASIDDFLNSTAWTNVSMTGGTFAFDTVGVPSPPHALRFHTTTGTGVTALATHALPTFTKLPSKLRLEFALRIDAGNAVATNSGAAFAGIIPGTRVEDGLIGIEIGPGPALLGGYVEADHTFKEFPFTTAFPPENQWLGRYAVEIVYSAPGGVRTGCAQIYRGTVAQLASCMALPSMFGTGSVLAITLGVDGGGFGVTGDVQLRFDDVTVTAQ